MKVAIVSRNVPLATGTAAGRALVALAEGVRAEGHEVRVWSWGPGPAPAALPDWCEWHAIPPESRWVTTARALARPRWDAARLELALGDFDVAVAETPVSYAAVAAHRQPVATVHHSAWIDLKAVGPRSPARLQDVRAERRAVGAARLTLAYSRRVAGTVGHGAVVVPIAYPVPDEPLPVPDEPAAACVADWRWPANAVALRLLRECWPLVRARLGPAVLVLAGPGLAAGPLGDGITALGPVASSADVLGGARLVVFPCPPTSGPKVKVIEALASGRPVVTTEAGAEGLCPGADGGVVTTSNDAPALAAAVAELLPDADRIASLGRAGRGAILAGHAPRPAARAHLAAWSRLA